MVIASANAQAPSGVLGLPCMPNDSTLRAWQTIAPSLGQNPGVMLELFNEPCKGSKAESQKEWAMEMQPLIDAVRSTGAKNILLLDGLFYARQTKGLFPLVHDSLPGRMALAVHPYLNKATFLTEKQWQDSFGSDAALISDDRDGMERGGRLRGREPAGPRPIPWSAICSACTSESSAGASTRNTASW